jgi:hypothetical protein
MRICHQRDKHCGRSASTTPVVGVEERPQGATDSELTEDGVLMRYRGSELVGVTILNARKRLGSGS